MGRPAAATEPSTVVARVYPSGDTVPANMLRMYIEFSAPMGRPSGVEFIHLLDHDGREIPGAVLPLDYEFWTPDHTRFTVFFDPGRVKKGILPNQQMGRPLEAGRTVTLVVDAAWRDAHGLPLKQGYRRQFRVVPPDEQPLDTAAWRIQAPAPGSRAPVAATFPKALDRGLLLRALSVTRDGKAVEGDVTIDQGETRWTLTPREPWRAGAYQLVALDILEDVAGNQIGRAFEVDNFDTVDKSPNPADHRDSLHDQLTPPGQSTYELPAIGRPKPRPLLPKVAVEEHFNFLTAAPAGPAGVDLSQMVKAMDYDATWMARIDERLVEIGPLRLAEMDAAGVDVCVLSHTVPGVQGIVAADEAVAAARQVNDFLAARRGQAPGPPRRVRQRGAAGSGTRPRASWSARSRGWASRA